MNDINLEMGFFNDVPDEFRLLFVIEKPEDTVISDAHTVVSVPYLAVSFDEVQG